MHDRGLVAPGQRADLVIVDSLEGCHAEIVLSAGRVVSEELFATRKMVAEVGRNSVKAQRSVQRISGRNLTAARPVPSVSFPARSSRKV